MRIISLLNNLHKNPSNLKRLTINNGMKLPVYFILYAFIIADIKGGFKNVPQTPFIITIIIFVTIYFYSIYHYIRRSCEEMNKKLKINYLLIIIFYTILLWLSNVISITAIIIFASHRDYKAIIQLIIGIILLLINITRINKLWIENDWK